MPFVSRPFDYLWPRIEARILVFYRNIQKQDKDKKNARIPGTGKTKTCSQIDI